MYRTQRTEIRLTYSTLTEPLIVWRRWLYMLISMIIFLQCDRSFELYSNLTINSNGMKYYALTIILAFKALRVSFNSSVLQLKVSKILHDWCVSFIFPVENINGKRQKYKCIHMANPSSAPHFSKCYNRF